MKFEKNPKYNTWALFALIVVAFAALLFSIAMHLPALGALLSRLYAILAPFIYAVWIMLFILPGLHLFSALFSALFSRRKKPLKNAEKLVGTLSLVAAYLALFLIVFLAVAIILPQFRRIYDIAISSRDYLLGFDAYSAAVSTDSFFGRLLAGLLGSLKASLSGILSSLPQYVPVMVDALKTMVSGASNWLIALFVSIYALADRRRLAAILRKSAAAFLPRTSAAHALHACRVLYENTLHFISSRITLSVTLGVFFYLLCLVMGLRFAALLGLVIAVCNFIPVFGLLFGGALGGVIVLITDTEKTILFLLLYLLFTLLNTFLLRPRYTHYSVRIGLGASAVCVLTGYFIAGFAGIIFAIPVFVTLRKLLPPLYRRAEARRNAARDDAKQ